MKTIDHKLMESLEYNGHYGGRYTCSQCKHFAEGNCAMLDNRVKVGGHNNVCRQFTARIKNPSSPDFNFDDYLEYLYSDYYRPWSVDTSIIIGSAKLGECVMDGGRLAELIPKTYSPLYKSYDKPFCMIHEGPRCHVYVGEHKFEIDYRKYRELAFINNNVIEFVVHLWKEKPTARKYQKEVNGRWSLDG
jgi:hypothetical protein